MDLQSKILRLIEQMRENASKASGKKNENVDYQLLNDLRKTHRELYKNIEANRKTNQLEKDQLDKQTISSECLKYSKMQLKQQIASFQGFETVCYNKLIKKMNLEKKNPLVDNQEILLELEKELKLRQEKKRKYEEMTTEFNQLQKQFEQKEQLYFQVLPDQIKLMQSNLVPVLKLFDIPKLSLPTQQEYYRLLHPALQKIYQKLQSKFLDTEIIQHGQGESHYKQSQFELKVTLENGIYDEMALNYLGVNQEQFYQNVYPLVFNIKYFTILEKIVFQVDRKNSITSEELFCGLFQGDSGEPIFANPKNDEEINMNSKYMTFQWTQQLIRFELSTSQFQQQLQKRIFNIQLLKIQLSKLQKNELPNLLPGLNFEQRWSLKYFGNAQISDPVPFWNQFCIGETILKPLKQNKSLLLDDQQLQSYIQLNYRYEGQPEHLHDCYKMILAKDDQQIEIGINIPLSYPQQAIRFLIVSTQNFELSPFESFQIFKNIGKCLIEGLQLSYSILRITQELSNKKQIVQYYLK